MDDSDLIDKRVQWDFGYPCTGTLASHVTGSGVVVSTGPGATQWDIQGLSVLVRLDSGKLLSLPYDLSHMRVCAEDPTV